MPWIFLLTKDLQQLTHQGLIPSASDRLFGCSVFREINPIAKKGHIYGHDKPPGLH